MLTVYHLKPRFQSLLRPLVARLARAGVTANAVTVGAVLLSLCAGGWIALAPGSPWPLLALPAVLLARMALNAVDGMLAREHGQATRVGAVLNEVGDLVSDAALVVPLALVPGFPGALVVALAGAAALTEVAGLAGAALRRGRRYEGPMGKSDRAVLIAGLGVAAGTGWATPVAIAAVLWLMLAGCALTAGRRLLAAFGRAR